MAMAKQYSNMFYVHKVFQKAWMTPLHWDGCTSITIPHSPNICEDDWKDEEHRWNYSWDSQLLAETLSKSLQHDQRICRGAADPDNTHHGATHHLDPHTAGTKLLLVTGNVMLTTWCVGSMSIIPPVCVDGVAGKRQVCISLAASVVMAGSPSPQPHTHRQLLPQPFPCTASH